MSQMNTDGIPRVHYTNHRLSFSKPTHGHISTSEEHDDGWVLVEDYSQVNPSSPKHNFSEEDARLLHQVQATNLELDRVKAIKRREIMRSTGLAEARELAYTQQHETKTMEETVVSQREQERRLLIQEAAAASYRRKQQHHSKRQPARYIQKSNRNNRARGQMKQPRGGNKYKNNHH